MYSISCNLLFFGLILSAVICFLFLFIFFPSYLGNTNGFFILEVIDWLAVEAEAEADVGRKVTVGCLSVEAKAEADVGRKMILGWLAVEAEDETDV